MVEHLRRRRDVVHGVEGVIAGGAIEEEGVSVLVIGGDVRGKGNAPQVGDWAAPACEHGLFRDADRGRAAVV